MMTDNTRTYGNANRNNQNRANNTTNFAEKIKQFTEDTYVDEAEMVIKQLKELNFKIGKDPLTTSQIRNLLAMSSQIGDELRVKEVTQVKGKLNAFRMQLIYQSGRNQAVHKLVAEAGLLDILKHKINDNHDNAVRLTNYMQALVAYFKFYGGKD